MNLYRADDFALEKSTLIKCSYLKKLGYPSLCSHSLSVAFPLEEGPCKIPPPVSPWSADLAGLVWASSLLRFHRWTYLTGFLPHREDTVSQQMS